MRLRRTTRSGVESLTVGKLQVEIHSDPVSAARAAAVSAAKTIILGAQIQALTGIIFATGASQIPLLALLTSMHDLPWKRIRGFHLDEYVGLPRTHRASFRRYLEERLVRRVPLESFHEIDGCAPDPQQICRDYAQRLRVCSPALCLLGIGENGHLAFNEPAEANFSDPVDVKMVTLDAACRRQQVAEKWFDAIEEVPQSAITLTIPAIFRVPKLITFVPGERKAAIVRRTLTEPISTAVPATILREHPGATLYLDHDSAEELGGLLGRSSKEINR